MPIPREINGVERTFTLASVFIDTNILVYSLDQYDLVKRERCRQLLQLVKNEHRGVISTQVIQEFYVAATSKLHADPLYVKNIVHTLKNLEIVLITPELIDNAIDIQILHRISFWDSLIIASAEHAQCQMLWTEDLTHGQIIRSVEVINPLK